MRDFKLRKSKEDHRKDIIRIIIGAAIWMWGSWRIFVFYCWIAHSIKIRTPLADTFSISMFWDRAYCFEVLGYVETRVDFFITAALSFLFAFFLIKIGVLVFPDDES